MERRSIRPLCPAVAALYSGALLHCWNDLGHDGEHIAHYKGSDYSWNAPVEKGSSQ